MDAIKEDALAKALRVSLLQMSFPKSKRGQGLKSLPLDQRFERRRKSGWRRGHRKRLDGLTVSVQSGNQHPLAEDLIRLRQAIALWEAKLAKFAERYSGSMATLESNPTWRRLLSVRDSLWALLEQDHRPARHESTSMLDQTRM